MANNAPKPVIFLAFANEQDDQARYLRQLPEEARRLRKVFDLPECPYELAFDQNITIDELIDALRQHRQQLAIFHYGGHAGSFGLLLESANGHSEIAYAGGLIKLLAQQPPPYLVFLNGCSTHQEAQALLKAGVPAVIATSDAIEDEAALQFATNFYQELIKDATIAEAFNRSEAVLETKRDGRQRGFFYRIKEAVPDGPPWTLYATDPAATQRRLADIIKDPFFGLPPLPLLDLPAQPFLGLQRFERKHAEIFFGRGVEIRDLYYHIADPATDPILLLYGQSGVGKSSLLEAGLLPRLAAEHLCLYTRRDPEVGLTCTLAKALCTMVEGKSLHQAWLDRECQAKKPVVVILDQVEELFTRAHVDQAGQAAELADFLASLSEIFADRRQRPCGKLILGFRKEYLAEIEQHLRDQLPYKPIFLEHLSAQGIQEAITGLTSTQRLQAKYGLTVDADLPAIIMQDLVEDPASPLAPTLQMLLTKLWEQAIEQDRSKPAFALALYYALKRKGLLLDDFLTQQLQLLSERNPAPVAAGLVLDMLFYHTTPLGAADQHEEQALFKTYEQHPPATLQLLVQQCKDLYLLADSSDKQAKAVSSSLAHDALAPLVHKRFHASVEPGQRARRILENRATEWTDGQPGTPLDDRDLNTVEQGRDGMRAWSADEKRLVEASHEAHKARQRDERSRRNLRRAAIGMIVLILMITVGVWAREQIRAQVDLTTDLVTESQNLKNLALQQRISDPVASLNLSQRTLPSEAAPRPYLPEAEFALRQVLYGSLEDQYVLATQPPLTKDQVAVGNHWIAIGGDAMHWVSLDLRQVITLTGSISPTKKVSWATAGETLLSYGDKQVAVWQDQRLVSSHTFTESIACAEWNPAGTQIAICAGKTLYRWVYQEKAAPEQIKEFPGIVLGAHWSPDHRWLAIWDRPSSQKSSQNYLIWDNQQNQVFSQTQIPYAERIQESTWSTDSLHMSAVGLVTSTLRIWQISAPSATKRITTTAKLDGLMFVDPEHFITWGVSDVTRLWSIDGTPMREFGTADDFVQGVALSPDKTQLLTFLTNGSAYLWDLPSASRLAELRGHEKRILGATWHTTPAGRYLATNSVDGTVRIWALPTNRERAPRTALVTLHGHTVGNANQPDRLDVLGMQWRDPQHLLTYGLDGSLRLWRVFDDQGLPLCEGVGIDNAPTCYAFSQALTNFAPALTAARWVDDQTLVIANPNGTASRCSLTTCETKIVNRNIISTSETIWSPDGQRVLTYIKGQGGQVVDFTTNTTLVTITTPITSAFWLKSGLLLSPATGGALLVQPETWITLTTFEHYTATITAAQQSTDGRLALADKNGLIHLWDTVKNQHVASFGQRQPLKDPQVIHTLVWSADGKRLLAVGSGATLWDSETGKLIWFVDDTGFPIHADLSPDGQLVAVTTGNTFLVFNPDSGEQLWLNQAHTQPVVGIQWVLGVRWPNQEPGHWFVGRVARVLSGGSWNPGPTRLLLFTWSGDGTTRLWEWETQKKIGTEIMRLPDAGTPRIAAVSPNGDYLFTAALQPNGNQTSARIWQTALQAPEALRQMALSRITRLPPAAQRLSQPAPTP